MANFENERFSFLILHSIEESLKVDRPTVSVVLGACQTSASSHISANSSEFLCERGLRIQSLISSSSLEHLKCLRGWAIRICAMLPTTKKACREKWCFQAAINTATLLILPEFMVAFGAVVARHWMARQFLLMASNKLATAIHNRHTQPQGPWQ